MMGKVIWRIYYGDGSTFDNTQGAPEDAPGRDVQIIVEADATTGRTLIHGNDFYCYDLARWGGWVNVDHFGLFDYLCEPGAKVVKFGRMLGHDAFSQILHRANTDADLPPRSAWRPKEFGNPG